MRPNYRTLTAQGKSPMDNLAEALPREIERVQGIREMYAELRSMPNVIVEPQIAMMDTQIKRAIVASAAGDVVEMLRAYAELKEWSV